MSGSKIVDLPPVQNPGVKPGPNWKRGLGYAIPGALALAAALLAQSETSLNKLVGQWFHSCIIVLEQQNARNLTSGQAVPFMLYGSGEVPDKFTFFLSAKEPVIAALKVAGPIPGKPQSNLAIHPMAGRECRGRDDGKYCKVGAAEKNGEDKKIFRDMAIKIFDYAPQYALTIEAELYTRDSLTHDPAKDLTAYITYAHDDIATSKTICRVETRNLFNILVWSGGILSTIMLVAAIGILGGLLALMRRALAV